MVNDKQYDYLQKYLVIKWGLGLFLAPLRGDTDRQTQTHTNWPCDLKSQLAKKPVEWKCSEYKKKLTNTLN